MADIELVIKIPEEIKAVIDKNGTNEIVTETLWQAVKNGTPLPKGHGRLGDLDILVKHNVISESYANMFTIIEADTESDG